MKNDYLYNGMELQDDLELDVYLADFRSYDPFLGRWQQIDPKANEFESPYVGMGNNPLKYADPAGDTVVYFIDQQAAQDNGHMGMAFQNGDGAWFYASQGAAGDAGNELLAGSNTEGGLEVIPLMVNEERAVMDENGNPVLDSDGNPVMETVERNATLNEVVAGAKSGAFGYTYDDHAVLNTSQEQDAQISQNAFKLQRDYQRGDKSYNLYFNNCTDACQDITQTGTGISLPYDFDPRPGSYFKSLKEYTDQFNKAKKK